jgi:hypothetical protein
MPKPVPRGSKPRLERASWIAGVVSAVLALLFGGYQVLQPPSGTSASVTGNSGPVVITQGSPGANVIVNVPAARLRTDQDNCHDSERWVGMTPSSYTWTGEVTPKQSERAVFYGQLRWSPEVNQRKATTRGVVLLEVDGVTTKIYEWNSPDESTHSFQFPISSLLIGTSGKFKVTWQYKTGSSGVCVAESRVGA